MKKAKRTLFKFCCQIVFKKMRMIRILIIGQSAIMKFQMIDK